MVRLTDYDCWHEGHADVTVSQVIKVLHDNAAKARALVKAAVPLLGTRPRPCAQGCENVLEHAVITAPEARDPAMLARLSAVAGRVLQ